jgi:hypothetical protein
MPIFHSILMNLASDTLQLQGIAAASAGMNYLAGYF